MKLCTGSVYWWDCSWWNCVPVLSYHNDDNLICLYWWECSWWKNCVPVLSYRNDDNRICSNVVVLMDNWVMLDLSGANLICVTVCSHIIDFAGIFFRMSLDSQRWQQMQSRWRDFYFGRRRDALAAVASPTVRVNNISHHFLSGISKHIPLVALFNK